MDLSWMAWTWQTAIFFTFIALALATITVWDILSPTFGRRVGVLGLETTRGDRLFLTLVGSAFIHLGWLGLVGASLWWALGLSILYAMAVFRWV